MAQTTDAADKYAEGDYSLVVCNVLIAPGAISRGEIMLKHPGQSAIGLCRHCDNFQRRSCTEPFQTGLADYTPFTTPICKLRSFSATSLTALPTTMDVQTRFTAGRLVLP